MATATGSIAAMNAILRTDLEVERMTEKQFRNEKLYLVTMKMAKALLKKGTMSADEYKQIDMIFLEKYKPSMGVLFSDVNLTVLEKREICDMEGVKECLKSQSRVLSAPGGKKGARGGGIHKTCPLDGHMPLHSLSAQVSYYSTLIQRNPEWEYVGYMQTRAFPGEQ